MRNFEEVTLEQLYQRQRGHDFFGAFPAFGRTQALKESRKFTHALEHAGKNVYNIIGLSWMYRYDG